MDKRYQFIKIRIEGSCGLLVDFLKGIFSKKFSKLRDLEVVVSYGELNTTSPGDMYWGHWSFV